MAGSQFLVIEQSNFQEQRVIKEGYSVPTDVDLTCHLLVDMMSLYRYDKVQIDSSLGRRVWSVAVGQPPTARGGVSSNPLVARHT